MGALQAQSGLQRQGEGENPKRRLALLDGPIDSRFAALTIMQPNAAKQLGMRIWTTVSSPVTAFTKVTSCTDNFSARLHMQYFFYVSKVGNIRPPSEACVASTEVRCDGESSHERVFMM